MPSFWKDSTRAGLHLLIAASIGLLTGGGCEPAPSGSGSQDVKQVTPPSPTAGSASKLLEEVADAYAKARTYQDAGELYIETEQKGRKHRFEPQPFFLAFERPNRFRVEVANAKGVSDGKLMRAMVNNIDQILTLPAPPELQINHLLSEPVLADAMSAGLEFALPTLRLLVGDKDLPGFRPKDNLSLLSSAKLGDETCARVEATTAAGKTIYWIDPQTKLLKRIEFATDAIIKKQGGQIQSLKIWADLKGARFNGEIESKAFEFEAPPNAALVKRFVPPLAAAPSSLLGQQIGEFSFDDLQQSGTLNRASLDGKVVVLDFWATWCGPCFEGLPFLQKVYDQYKDNDKVVILAVNTDDASASDDDVKKSFADAKLHVPIVRDRNKQFAQVFGVEVLPTLVVLDAKGTIQHVHLGLDEELDKKLPEIIDQLLAGKELAKETMETHEAARRKYEQDLNDALIGTTSTVEVPEAKIAQQSQPSKLKLEQLWKTQDITFPGNLMVVEQPGDQANIYVISGSREIRQLAADGTMIQRYDLDLPKEIGVSWLRTAVDASGSRYFAAFASTQQRLYLFDQTWKQLLAYPDSDHAGIADVQLADLKGDGQPEIVVGYWGVVGVQAASFTGERTWSNRQLENVSRLAVSDPADDGRRFILGVNGRDFITPIDYDGKAQPEIRVPGQALYALYTADLNGTPPLEMCALSSSQIGILTAIGLNASGDTLWNYPLPNGIHNQPVELVTPGRLPANDGGTQGVWLLTGLDGSVHILSADGHLIDQFNYGDELTGIATAMIEGTPALVIATAKEVTAWRVESSE